MRGLSKLLLTLPPDLLRFELELGMAERSRLLFEPLAALARAQRAVLAHVAAPRRTRTDR